MFPICLFLYYTNCFYLFLHNEANYSFPLWVYPWLSKTPLFKALVAFSYIFSWFFCGEVCFTFKNNPPFILVYSLRWESKWFFFPNHCPTFPIPNITSFPQFCVTSFIIYYVLVRGSFLLQRQTILIVLVWQYAVVFSRSKMSHLFIQERSGDPTCRAPGWTTGNMGLVLNTGGCCYSFGGKHAMTPGVTETPKENSEQETWSWDA